jgi:hypothetical protein
MTITTWLVRDGIRSFPQQRPDGSNPSALICIPALIRCHALKLSSCTEPENFKQEQMLCFVVALCALPQALNFGPRVNYYFDSDIVTSLVRLRDHCHGGSLYVSGHVVLVPNRRDFGATQPNWNHCVSSRSRAAWPGIILVAFWMPNHSYNTGQTGVLQGEPISGAVQRPDDETRLERMVHLLTRAKRL